MTFNHAACLNEFPIGAEYTRMLRVSETHLVLASMVFGTNGPAHTDEAYEILGRRGRVVPGSLLSGWISALIADTFLPMAGAYLGESIRFRGAVRPGDDIRLTIRIQDNAEREGKAQSTITIVTEISASDGQLLADGQARLLMRHSD